MVVNQQWAGCDKVVPLLQQLRGPIELSVRVERPPVTISELTGLRNVAHLVSLRASVLVTDADLAPLGELPRLTRLTLYIR